MFDNAVLVVMDIYWDRLSRQTNLKIVLVKLYNTRGYKFCSTKMCEGDRCHVLDMHAKLILLHFLCVIYSRVTCSKLILLHEKLILLHFWSNLNEVNFVSKTKNSLRRMNFRHLLLLFGSSWLRHIVFGNEKLISNRSTNQNAAFLILVPKFLFHQTWETFFDPETKKISPNWNYIMCNERNRNTD